MEQNVNKNCFSIFLCFGGKRFSGLVKLYWIIVHKK